MFSTPRASCWLVRFGRKASESNCRLRTREPVIARLGSSLDGIKLIWAERFLAVDNKLKWTSSLASIGRRNYPTGGFETQRACVSVRPFMTQHSRYLVGTDEVLPLLNSVIRVYYSIYAINVVIRLPRSIFASAERSIPRLSFHHSIHLPAPNTQARSIRTRPGEYPQGTGLPCRPQSCTLHLGRMPTDFTSWRRLFYLIRVEHFHMGFAVVNTKIWKGYCK